MTLVEFRAWLNGFRQAKSESKWSQDDIKLVLSKLELVYDPAPTPIYVPYPQPYYPPLPYTITSTSLLSQNGVVQ